MRRIVLCFLLAGINVAYTQKTPSVEEIDNLIAFSELYGYVKYFHPSDEASNIDWGNFSIYGADEILNNNQDKDIFSKLSNLFCGIAPSLRIYKNNDNAQFPLDQITPENAEKYKLTFWQHLGLSLNMKDTYRSYKSIRVNRKKIDENATGAYGRISKIIDASDYLGKEIKLSAMVKMKSLDSSTGHLRLQVIDKDGTTSFLDFMRKNPILLNEWVEYSISTKVNSSAEKISIGCGIKGKGTILIDKMTLRYKTLNKWLNIPISNSSFEEENPSKYNIFSRKFRWEEIGEGYLFKQVSDDVSHKKKSFSIQYIRNNSGSLEKPIFNYEPKFGELIEEQMGDNLYCKIPLVLYTNKEHTFPQADKQSFKWLENQIKSKPFNVNDLSCRIGNVINTYNVFKHFYPYFDVVDVDWKEELRKALIRSYKDKSLTDHQITLQKFTASLKDGHIDVSIRNKRYSAPPVTWEWIENKLVITNVLDTSLPIQIGDIVTHIDQKSSFRYFEEINSRISSGTKGFRDYKARYLSLVGEENSTVSITIDKKTVLLKRNRYPFGEAVRQSTHEFLENNVIYLNLNTIEMNEIEKLMPKLEKARAIVCDLRERPASNHGFISHLLKEKDTTTSWMQTPKIVYPNHEKIVDYRKRSWRLKSKTPYLGDKKIVFIISGSAISYAESYMGYIRGYNMATIIGQPTAGANGNVNDFELPGGVEIRFTGMKVLKHDGSTLHGVGILPDIYVDKTIDGLMKGKDEFLEKAIEIANQ